MNNITLGFLANSQSRLQPVGLLWVFARWVLRSKKTFHLSYSTSTQPRPWNSFAFLASKETELLWRSLFTFWWHMRHVTLVMVAYLFKNHFEFFFDRMNSILLTKLIDYSHFLLCNKKKLLGMHIFLKTALTSKKHPLKVTSTTFLFREVEILVVYSSCLISLIRRLWMNVFW